MTIATAASPSLAASQLARCHWDTCVDRTAATEPGRRAAMARFDQQVDPAGVLPPDERARLADQARRAFYRDLGRRSGEARRARKAVAAGGGA